MIRALGAANVAVAGADKFKLTDDQGVLDLLSYARAILFKGDDLSLAETLKSPFFNIDEDGLYDLAANREGGDCGTRSTRAKANARNGGARLTKWALRG